MTGQFLENLVMESRRIQAPAPPPPQLPPFFPQAIHPQHPYLLLNNSFINQFPFNRFAPPPKDFPLHFSTPKKRRTKVTDTRLSPRVASKIPLDDLSDDEHSSSQHSSDENPSKSDHQSLEYNGFQISDLPFESSPLNYTCVFFSLFYVRVSINTTSFT